MVFFRPRRNRKSAAIRALVQETHLHPSQLIYPLFLKEGKGHEPINSMPGIYRFGLDLLLKEVERALSLGIQAVALFPVIASELKDLNGSYALNPKSFFLNAIGRLKKEFPMLCLIGDVALDPYTSHGHDGLIDENIEVLNDPTVDILISMALLQAEAGIDMVAPSDMMDGRVKKIRQALDSHHFTSVGIHAYSAKYASCFFAPFRDAVGSNCLLKGDKKGYQLNPANRREAVREALLDEAEGADILMVKPALPYLDVIAKLRDVTSLPLSAFQVSGEYAMILAAEERGWISGDAAFLESMLSIKRAGADMIFTYGACRIATLLKSSLSVDNIKKSHPSSCGGPSIAQPGSHTVVPHLATTAAIKKI